MTSLQQTILDYGLSYFPLNIINNYINIIGDIEDSIMEYFFQVSQEEDEPFLEFVSHCGDAITDITLRGNEISIVTFSLSAIQAVHIRLTDTTTHLRIISSATSILNYRAVSDISRSQLQKFGKHIESILRKGEN